MEYPNTPQPIDPAQASPQGANPPQEAHEQAVNMVSDTIGQLMEFWGFKHIMGRLWAVLFFSPEPLSAPQIADRLCVSSGAVSMALKDLLVWGAVKKVCIPEKRKDHFIAEHNLWKLISRVLAEREGHRIEEALDNIDEALNVLQKQQQGHAALAFQIKRLEELRRFAQLGRKFLKILLTYAKVDITPLRHLFEEKRK